MITPKKRKVIVIVGPTSVGKTSISIEIAKKLKTDVVSADSRQVYKGLDIGSGKIKKEEMDGVKHYMLDIADPKNVFSASDFVLFGKEALNKIFEENKIPIIIGGTGFYIDALLEKVLLPNVPPNLKLRKVLEKLSIEELQDRLQNLDKDRYESIDLNNKRRIVRAIEIAETIGKNPKPETNSPYEVFWIGLEMPNDVLRERIKKRLMERLNDGMLEEAKTLKLGGLTYERMEELGLEYRYMAKHLKGEISYEEMLEVIESESLKYAKRQMTWFKKNKEINWFSPNQYEEIIKKVEDFVVGGHV